MRVHYSSFVTFVIAISSLCHAFEFPNLSGIFKPPISPIQSPSNVISKKAALLQTISSTANGKDATPEVQTKVLEMVADLEKSCPVSETLLSDPNKAMLLDGIWYLQYTSPSVLNANDEFPVRMNHVYRLRIEEFTF
jgi:PAP_fibrillin